MKLALGLLAAFSMVAVSVWLLGSDGSLGSVFPGADPVVEDGPIEAPFRTYDPIREGEETPDGFHQLLARDQIRPVYNPQFRTAAETDWDPDTLVIGVALDGEAKAYPVNVLSYREMVTDWIGGTPILVSW